MYAIRSYYEPHQPVVAALLTIRAEEQDGGRGEQLEVVEQCEVLGVVGGDVGLQQGDVGQCGLHLRVGEGVS